MKNIHPFNVSSIDISIETCIFYRDLCLFKFAICKFFASNIFKNSKGIAPNAFPNILISMSPENISPHY